MLEVCTKPCGDRCCRSTHDRSDNGDDAVLVHSALRTHEGNRRISMRVLENDVHLALEVRLFVGEEGTLHCGGTEFGKVARKRGKHEHGRKTCAKTFKSAYAFLGGLLQTFGRCRPENLLVPVPGSAVALGILAFSTDLELHPAHDFAIDRILFKERLELVSREERCRQSLDDDVFCAGPCSRVGRIRKYAEHRFDAIEHGTLFDIDNSAGKFHAFAVSGLHMIFQEAGSDIVGIVLLVCTEIALRKHDRSLFAFNLAERRAVYLLQRGNRIRAAAALDHGLYIFDIVLCKRRSRNDRSQK